MALKGIFKRWFINSMSYILILLFVIILCFAVVLNKYYYNGIQQTINGNVSGVTSYFLGYTNNSEDFNSLAILYVETFQEKEQMQIMAYDCNNNILITSTGFIVDGIQELPDYEQALNSKDGYATCIGRLNTGEHVMSTTQSVYNLDGYYLGSIRYVVSLVEADKSLALSSFILLFVGIIFVVLIVILNVIFIRSITKPLEQISSIVERISKGDFKARIERVGGNEIGKLSETINNMATELESYDKVKNEFMSSISHELRTPLTAIKGWGETMLITKQIDEKTLTKGLQIIVRETERLSQMVEELLDFSRMQNESIILMLDKIDLLAEIDEAVYMYNERATSEHKHLVFEQPDELPPVMADKNRIRQVFLNIIDNAFKYTQENGVINISTEVINDEVHIIVSDNGCGIPLIHLPRIKEKFYKANQSKRGSGIGLAVANEIILLHSGSLRIESEEGVGTTVIISIPIIKSESVTSTEDIQDN